MATVKFTAMKDGDRQDYEFLTAHEIDYAARTGERLLDALVQLDEGLSGYKITRLGHSCRRRLVPGATAPTPTGSPARCCTTSATSTLPTITTSTPLRS